jgi:hypothetical protein
MTAPGASSRRSTAVRLAGIGLLAAAVTGALYAAGRLHAPNYTVSLFGQAGLAAVTLKSLLASIALGLAIVQVLLALWLYRRFPLAGSPPRPVRLTHRIIGFALFALTVPIAVHCLLAYGVQLTGTGWPCTLWPGACSTARSPPRYCWYSPGGCPAGRCQPPAASSPSSSPSCGTPRPCGTTTATSSPQSNCTSHGRARAPAPAAAWPMRLSQVPLNFGGGPRDDQAAF